MYFERAQQEAIRRMLPQKAQTLEEALADFAKTQRPGAASFGQTIDADDRYVGDVWVYAIDRNDTPNAMLSYCVFDQCARGRGVATEVVQQFLMEACDRVRKSVDLCLRRRFPRTELRPGTTGLKMDFRNLPLSAVKSLDNRPKLW
ncbi:MAG: GNAT family N-acetyltransferase [Clostridiales bacterium]|nr:GNAT family N-acetyltransferase [Clostridiales bacterium]